MAQLVVIPPVYSVSPTTLLGPWSSVLYVDNVRGNDTTGTRGNDNRPFATIQAAVDAMSTFDVVQIAPQSFALTAPITIPATVVRAYFSGPWGPPDGTSVSNPPPFPQIRNATGACFNLGANLGLTKAVFTGLIITGVGAKGILADGSLYAANTFLAAGLRLVQCIATVDAKYVAVVPVFFTNCGNSGDHSIVNCAGATFIGTANFSGSLLCTYDATDPLSPTNQSIVTLRNGSQIGGVVSSTKLTIGGQVTLYIDETSGVGGLTASALSVSGAKAPSISCCGYIGQTSGIGIDFASAGAELPDTATVLTMDFRGSKLYKLTAQAGLVSAVIGVTTAKFKVAGAAANFQTVKLDSTVALPGCTFTADAAIHMTMRGAIAPQAVYTTPGANGDIVPPHLEGVIDLSAAVGARTWVQLGYAGLIRTGAAPDVAFETPNAAAADPCITAKTAAGLTFGGNVVAGNNAANWQAIWK